jgi:hypothetical protein
MTQSLPPARAGDADREAVAERLRVAAGEGRIDLTELSDRLEQAYAARTYDELDTLLADLPQGRSAAGLAPLGGPGGSGAVAGVAGSGGALSALGADAADPDTLVLETTSANIKQSGRWSAPRRILARSTSGLIKIDFTQASCAHREVTVEAICGTGWITLIVPRGWAVRIDPASSNTANIRNKAAVPADPAAPTLNVLGRPRYGYVRIRNPR